MSQITHIGLDVHKDTIAVAVLRSVTGEIDERVVPNTPAAVRKLLGRHDPGLTRICYEAGPTGYDTHQLVSSLGFQRDVIARQRIRSFLLRYGKRYPHGPDRWSHRFEVWARSLTFDEKLAQEAFANLLGAYFVRDAQLAEMGRRIEELAATEPFAEGVTRLSALRGIGTLSAMTILAETCDFARFGDAGSYMAFTGLVPSEHSSGASRHQGSITKTGNRHVRRVLVESAWAYRHAPAVRGKLKERLEGQAPEIAAYSWAAQVRLNGTFRRISARKGAHTAVVATARELSGFVWGLMTDNLGPAR